MKSVNFNWKINQIFCVKNEIRIKIDDEDDDEPGRPRTRRKRQLYEKFTFVALGGDLKIY